MNNLENDYFSLVIPDIGDAEKIVIVTWKNKLGDKINLGDEVVEIETDKASFPLESPVQGILEKKTKNDGDLVKVGELIGVIKISH